MANAMNSRSRTLTSPLSPKRGTRLGGNRRSSTSVKVWHRESSFDSTDGDNSLGDRDVAATIDKRESSKDTSEYISECATAWSVLGFVLTSSRTSIYVGFALTKDAVYSDFYAWVSMPTCFIAMAVSGLLKPRRTDSGYMMVLYIQYAILTLGSEILIVIGEDWKQFEILKSSVRSVLYGVILFVVLRIRSSIARLSDSDLSEFLSMSVIKYGLVTGLAQLVFLAFSSVQCLSEARVEGGGDWKACKRSLYSQTGLGGLVALYTIIMFMTGVAPKRYIDRHIIKPKMIAKMDLDLEEVRRHAKANPAILDSNSSHYPQTVQVLGLSVAAGCSLFLLGNYGVKGDFRNSAEEWWFFSVMVSGAASLLITAVWKGHVIHGEIKLDEAIARTGSVLEDHPAGELRSRVYGQLR